MLGEKVGTFTGTTTDKVMPAQGGLPSFETSAQTSGSALGKVPKPSFFLLDRREHHIL